MAVNLNNYNPRGNNNVGIVVRCPNLVADRLVYFDRDSQTGSWVIRDFISGQQLDHLDSHLTVANIEADANHDEFPPWHNAQNLDDWRIYLSLRTTAVFALRMISTALPNAPLVLGGPCRPPNLAVGGTGRTPPVL